MHSVHIIYKLFDCNFDIPIYIFDITYIYIYIYIYMKQSIQEWTK